MMRFLYVLLVLIGADLVLVRATAAEHMPAIAKESRLVKIDEHRLHVRELGVAGESPTLVLLSGPTDNWHSDSAWWVLAQNYLSQSFHTLLIDRAGQGWSDAIKEPSYRQFAKDLRSLLSDERFVASGSELLLVAFASSNLSVNVLLQDADILRRVAGVVLIDPDVLKTHSIQHYTSETEKYKAQWKELEAYIRSGKYDERIKQKITDEREHLQQIVPARLKPLMDWHYYDAIEMIRQTRAYQVNKFLEMTAYLEDLELARQQPIPANMPLVIIDTDFEAAYLKQIEDEAIKRSIARWRKEGVEWYFELAENSECGAYWPVDTEEHLLMMTQPELIEQAIDKILACSKTR
ncbi:alpha/beta fold hydrolase [Kangiella shandongensis]|uniref:alpha/beta fold hydrolase n=1 Tax=Kangiella shandongensis TaxID=2763258 RepID=UPI001CBB2869|nr:alpha/beta hydrolase [Kangiella shandongensis]